MNTVLTEIRIAVVAAGALFVVSCSGTIGADEPGGEPGRVTPAATAPKPAVPAPGAGSPMSVGDKPAGEADRPGAPIDPAAAGPRPVLRLTRFELNNTLRDLLGDTSNPAVGLLSDDIGPHGFEVAAGVSAAEATILQEIAEKIATDAVKARLASLIPCAPAAGDDACARQFIATFAKRAWRRPLLTDEQAAVEALYTAARKSGQDFAQGIRVVITALLQSPDFLYHLERLGSRTVKAGALVQLSSWELASRVSYFLAGTMPDGELFAAAESGALLTPTGLTAQVTRLFGQLAVRASMGELTRQWLGLSRIDRLAKDPAIKEWTPAVRAGLVQETQRFVAHVMFDGDGRVETLLTAPFSFLNDALGPLYGVTIANKDFQKTPLDAGQRTGLLGQGSFLAAQAGPSETSPVKRGNFVLTKLLCRSLPAPPENVPPLPPSSVQARTIRQRTIQHATDPACSACHALMDPIGLGFESYDAVGKFRTMEKTDVIDPSGKVTLDGQLRTFTGPVELVQALGKSADVRACVGQQVFRYALGRAESNDDRAALAQAQAALAKGNLRDLVSTIPTTRSFTHRLPSAGEVLP